MYTVPQRLSNSHRRCKSYSGLENWLSKFRNGHNDCNSQLNIYVHCTCMCVHVRAMYNVHV